MKIAFFNIYEELNKNNFLFENNNTTIGDNLLTPMVRLREHAESQNIEIGTIDKISIDEADVIVFIDMPKANNVTLAKAIRSHKPLYLIALESPLITPRSYDEVCHKLFQKVFTWSDDLVKKDPTKYVKINYSYNMPQKIKKNIALKEKLCCIISGNKKVSYKNELYSERLKAIEWFEKNYPEDFDLYGIGWESYRFNGPKIIRALNRIKPLTKLLAFASNRPSYRGKVERKKHTLERYKFSICYENAKDINGYITEKIFDCFFAGCVPIYWGANNITDHIPKECFIDKREFKNYEELYEYIKNISDGKYLEYLDAIEEFFNSEKAYQFSSNKFTKTILQQFK